MLTQRSRAAGAAAPRQHGHCLAGESSPGSVHPSLDIPTGAGIRLERRTLGDPQPHKEEREVTAEERGSITPNEVMMQRSCIYFPFVFYSSDAKQSCYWAGLSSKHTPQLYFQLLELFPVCIKITRVHLQHQLWSLTTAIFVSKNNSRLFMALFWLPNCWCQPTS